MGFKVIDLLLCFNYLRADTIESLLMILSLIGTILSILGIIFIPWKVTSSTFEILFMLTLVFIAMSLIVSIIFYCLRLKLKISKRRISKIAISTIIFIVLFSFLSLIFMIIIAIGVVSQINNKEVYQTVEIIEQTGETVTISEKSEDIAKNSEKIVSVIIISILIFIWLIIILLWTSEYVRLILNIEGSYKEYMSKEKERQLRHPLKYGLNVIGHDKYGFPIFGKQIGNTIKIKGVRTKYEEKEKSVNVSQKYFDDNGKINTRYYSNNSNIPITKEKQNEIIQEKEKYLEKYFDGENIYQNYTNFENKTILNFDENINSINAGY